MEKVFTAKIYTMKTASWGIELSCTQKKTTNNNKRNCSMSFIEKSVICVGDLKNIPYNF